MKIIICGIGEGDVAYYAGAKWTGRFGRATLATAAKARHARKKKNFYV
jgi:hypothetical protein